MMFGSSVTLMLVGLLVCICTIGIAERARRLLFGVGSILIGIGTVLMGFHIFE